MRLIFSLIALSTLLLSNLAFANETSKGGTYIFKNRVYKLNKFVDQVNEVIDEGLDKNNIPPMINLKKYQTPVKNQSDRGACAYFSSTALLESEIKRLDPVKNANINISEEHLIWYTKSVLGQSQGDDGSFSGSNLRALGDGFLLERDAPYQPSWFSPGLPCANYKDTDPGVPFTCYSHKAPARHRENTIRVNGLKVHRLYYNSLQEIIYPLAQGRSVISNLPVNQKGWDSKTGFSQYTAEMREECRKDKDLCGGHSVVLTGYDLEKEVFFFKNSWGDDWGQKGYGTLPFDYVLYHNQGNMYISIGDVQLPRNISYQPEAVVNGVEFNVNPNDNGSISTAVGAKVSYTSNALLYMSTFLATKKEDADYKYLMYPEALREDKGYYLRGYFYKPFGVSNTLSFDLNNSPASNSISHQYISSADIGEDQLYARVSIYIYTDTEGWKKIYREFKPININ